MNLPPTLRELAAMVPPAPFAQVLAPNAALGQFFYGFAAPPAAPSPSPSPASAGAAPLRAAAASIPALSTFPSSFAMALNDMAILNRAGLSGAPPATISQMSFDAIPQMTPELICQIHILARSQGAPSFPQGGGADARSDRCGERGNGGSGGIAAAATSGAVAAATVANNQLSSAFACRDGSLGTLPFPFLERESAVGSTATITIRGIVDQPPRSDYLLQTQHPSAPFKSSAPLDLTGQSIPSFAPPAHFAASRGPSAFQQHSCGIPPLAVAETDRPVARQPLTRRPSANGATLAEIASSRRGIKRTSGAGADSAAYNNASAVVPATVTAPASAARRRGSSGPVTGDGASSGGSSSGDGDSPRAGEEPAEAAETTAPAAAADATAAATAAAMAAWEQHQWSRGLAELVSADGHRWLKYGAKKLSTKNGGQRRAYYRCAASSPHHRTAGSSPCPARKVVNSHPLRPFDLSAVTVEYVSEHNHPVERERLVLRDYKGRRVPRAGNDGAAAGEDGVIVESADVSPAIAADGEAWTAAVAAAAAAAAAAVDDRGVSHDDFPFEEDTPQLRDFMGVGGKESSQGMCVKGAAEHDISRSNSSVTEHCVEPVEQPLLRTGAADRGSEGVDGQVDVELHLACTYGSAEQRINLFAGEGVEGCQTGFKGMRFSEGGCYTGVFGMGAVA